MCVCVCVCVCVCELFSSVKDLPGTITAKIMKFGTKVEYTSGIVLESIILLRLIISFAFSPKGQTKGMISRRICKSTTLLHDTTSHINCLYHIS